MVPADDVTAVVNTGDDMVLHGLSISPDLDTVLYTLTGRNDEERGWGLAGETWRVMEALETLGGAAWFRLGDLDLATHLYRTQRLAEGATLSQVSAELCERLGLRLRMLPMSDEPVRTRLRLAETAEEVAFQEYFVKLRHDVPVSAVRFDGAAQAAAAPGVLEALGSAETVLICPSNPVVSIGPILAVPGVSEVLARRRDRVVAVSPIVAGAALKGPADRMLRELGGESSVVGVARHYAAVAGTLVIDTADAAAAGGVEAAGMRCVVARTVMHGPEEAAALASTILAAMAPAPS